MKTIELRGENLPKCDLFETVKFDVMHYTNGSYAFYLDTKLSKEELAPILLELHKQLTHKNTGIS